MWQRAKRETQNKEHGFWREFLLDLAGLPLLAAVWLLLVLLASFISAR